MSFQETGLDWPLFVELFIAMAEKSALKPP
jgi:hypothetical protein